MKIFFSFLTVPGGPGGGWAGKAFRQSTTHSIDLQEGAEGLDCDQDKTVLRTPNWYISVAVLS